MVRADANSNANNKCVPGFLELRRRAIELVEYMKTCKSVTDLEEKWNCFSKIHREAVFDNIAQEKIANELFDSVAFKYCEQKIIMLAQGAEL